MKVKWLGHAAFLITSEAGTRIITDPFGVYPGLNYKPITETADVVTVSHAHGDHNDLSTIKGNPKVVRDTATVKGITFKAVTSYHDNAGGKEKGNNTIFCFEVDGVTVCHAGDLGHQLNDKQAAELGKVDILIIPVGGFFTIDAKTATEVVKKVSPKVVIPMHYKNEKCTFPIAGVDEFLKGKTDVIQPNASEVEFKRDNLPATTHIIVLKPA